MLSCVCVESAVILGAQIQIIGTEPLASYRKSKYTMKKGKTLTALVLVLEIASITVLHAVKLNQSEKTATKAATRNANSESQETRPKVNYSLASFK